MRIRVLVTVKAYPSIGKTIGESVCVAGINVESGAWVRLYPLPFRELPPDQQFSKYATIEVDVRKPRDDSRPESLRCDADTIRVVSKPLPAGASHARAAAVLPLLQPSMCEIQRLQKVDGTSLGVFRPKRLVEFEATRIEEGWSPEKQARIDQSKLLGPEVAPLEKIPYSFAYRYECEEKACGGHRMTIIDWEIMEAFRKWRRSYGEDRALALIRKKWAHEMWGRDREAFPFTGNQKVHRQTFMILGVFWPPRGATGGRPSGGVQGKLLPPR